MFIAICALSLSVTVCSLSSYIKALHDLETSLHFPAREWHVELNPRLLHPQSRGPLCISLFPSHEPSWSSARLLLKPSFGLLSPSSFAVITQTLFWLAALGSHQCCLCRSVWGPQPGFVRPQNPAANTASLGELRSVPFWCVVSPQPALCFFGIFSQLILQWYLPFKSLTVYYSEQKNKQKTKKDPTTTGTVAYLSGNELILSRIHDMGAMLGPWNEAGWKIPRCWEWQCWYLKHSTEKESVHLTIKITSVRVIISSTCISWPTLIPIHISA